MAPPLTAVTANKSGQKLLLCMAHQQCLSMSTCEKHLQKDHVTDPILRRAWIEDWKAEGIVTRWEDYKPPETAIPAIPGLPVEDGFECSACKYTGVKLATMNKHWAAKHKRESTEAEDRYASIPVQKLGMGPRGINLFFKVLQDKAPAGLDPEASDVDKAEQRRLDWEAASTPVKAGTVQPFQHVSEETPWLTRTGYPQWMMGQDEAKLAHWSSSKLAKHSPVAVEVGEAAVSLFRKGILQLGGNQGQGRRLHSAIARVLNSFDNKQTNPDPVKTPQNEQTRVKYGDVLRGLIMFYIDSALDGKSPPPFIQGSTDEDSALKALVQIVSVATGEVHDKGWPLAGDAALQEITEPIADEDSKDDPGERPLAKPAPSPLTKIESATLQLCMLLIRRRTPNAFDSPILAYAATQSRDFLKGKWKEPRTHTSWISALLFGCQMMILTDAIEGNRLDPAVEVAERVEDTMSRYVASSSTGPLSELASIRLYGMVVARRDVGGPQVWWNDEGTIVRYKALEISMDQIRQVIADQLEKAATILHRRLCFGLEPPELSIASLKDDWCDKTDGGSFLSNPLNAEQLAPSRGWFLQHLAGTAAVRGGLLGGDEKIAEGKYAEYVGQVGSFLEHMMIGFHMGSGQPARRPEFQGIRWRNKDSSKRNLLIHDGRVLFVIQYHKSQSLTNGSRWPVRFLPPLAAKLIVRYLTTVLPLLQYATMQTAQQQVSPYLWTKDCRTGPVSDETLTRVLLRETKISVGVDGLNVAAWRQIAVGIAIRHMGTDEKDVVTMPVADGDGGADTELVLDFERNSGVPDVVHWQGSHNPVTANTIYGGTIDFERALTNAGLQAFKWASLKWQLMMNLEKDVTDEELAAMRMPPPPPPKKKRRLLRWWTESEMEDAFRTVYGPEAEFRPNQQETMLTVANASQYVLVVMKTGSGKSALYQVPTMLEGAATTVLVVPLVGLKLDTVKRCKSLGIRHQVWSDSEPPPPDTPLVIVSAEEATSPEGKFVGWARRMVDDDLLDRIVIDEAHLLGTACSYRPSLARLSRLRELEVPLVFLTGTLPHKTWQSIESEYGLHGVFILREHTNRSDLSYTVTNIQGDVDPKIAGIISLSPGRAKGEKTIVIVPTKQRADQFTKWIPCAVFHSGVGGKEKKLEVLNQWRAGNPPVLVSTPEALTGLDCPDVRRVIFADQPESCLGFAQDAGRAGRDGEGGEVEIVINSSDVRPWPKDNPPAPTPPDVFAMSQFVSTRGCRRYILSEYLDGSWGAKKCKEPYSFCDNCTDSWEDRFYMSSDKPQEGKMKEPTPEPEPADESILRSSSSPLEVAKPQPLIASSRTGTSSSVKGGLKRGYSSHREEGTTPATSNGSGASRRQEPTPANKRRMPEITTAKKYHQEMSGKAKNLRDYELRLEKLKGNCMICWISGRPRQRHNLGICPSTTLSADYMMSRQRMKSFLKKYTCCFKCGAAQDLCGAYKIRGSICELDEIVLPLTWAVRGRDEWQEIIRGLEAAEAQESERSWGVWLAMHRSIEGMWSSNNMNELARQLVEQMVPA